jgi:hypothetical protein
VFEALSNAWVETFGLWNDGRGIGDVLAHWRASAAGIGAPVAVNQDGGRRTFWGNGQRPKLTTNYCAGDRRPKIAPALRSKGLN